MRDGDVVCWRCYCCPRGQRGWLWLHYNQWETWGLHVSWGRNLFWHSLRVKQAHLSYLDRLPFWYILKYIFILKERLRAFLLYSDISHPHAEVLAENRRALKGFQMNVHRWTAKGPSAHCEEGAHSHMPPSVETCGALRSSRSACDVGLFSF